MRDLRRLGVGCPAARVRKLLVELHVPFHRALLTSALGRRHLVFGLADTGNNGVDAAHGDDAVACLHRRITHVRVLRQVTDRPIRRDGAGVFGSPSSVTFAREQPHRRRLSRAVTADEANTHAFIDTEARMVDELAGADAQREILDVNHPPRVEGGVRVGESTRLRGGAVAHHHATSGHNGCRN